MEYLSKILNFEETFYQSPEEFLESPELLAAQASMAYSTDNGNTERIMQHPFKIVLSELLLVLVIEHCLGAEYLSLVFRFDR